MMPASTSGRPLEEISHMTNTRIMIVDAHEVVRAALLALVKRREAQDRRSAKHADGSGTEDPASDRRRNDKQADRRRSLPERQDGEELRQQHPAKAEPDEAVRGGGIHSAPGSPAGRLDAASWP